MGGASGAAGHVGGTFTFRNISSSTCTLFGYPGMLMLNSSGAAIHTEVVRGSSVVVPAISPTTVTLHPSRPASFFFGYADVPTGSQTCPASTRVEITPPNAFGHLIIAANLSPCGGVITVSPVVAGAHPRLP